MANNLGNLAAIQNYKKKKKFIIAQEMKGEEIIFQIVGNE